MAGRGQGFARALLATLLAPALLSLLVSPARSYGGQNHGDGGEPTPMPPLPPREDAARVARFVTHVSDWGALATISALQAVRGQPFADVLSLSDGPRGAGSGVPYFFLSPLQLSVRNLEENPHASLTMSLAQTDFCKRNVFDPQSPLCAHIMLSGALTKVSSQPREDAWLQEQTVKDEISRDYNTTDAHLGYAVIRKVNETEMDFAKHSLFTRHPEMKTWPSSHNWFFAKLNITNIWVMDYFGGPKIVTPEEYYNVTIQ